MIAAIYACKSTDQKVSDEGPKRPGPGLALAEHRDVRDHGWDTPPVGTPARRRR
jgi:hypothetical protein